LGHIFEKLADLLPEKVRIRPEDMFNRFSFRCPPARAVTPENWAAVIRGLCEQRTLKMRYRKATVAATEPAKESLFNPYHVANLQGEWYMFGVYAGQTDVRQFSMARIEKAVVTAAAFQVPADFDAQKLLADTFGRFSGQHESHTVRLLFSKVAAAGVEDREWHPQQVVRRRRTGELELAFPAKGLYEVERWVLAWGHDVKVLEPKALRDAVQAEIRLMAKAIGQRAVVSEAGK
jgi:proteasome accessory factor B